MEKSKQIKRRRRHSRVRSKIQGTAKRPRLNVFRSHQHIYAQLIDDEKGKVLASYSDLRADKRAKKKTKTGKAEDVGEAIAQLAAKNKIKRAVFDRGGYKYHGRVRAVAEGARKGGLKF